MEFDKAGSDVFDSRDVIERITELENLIENEDTDSDDREYYGEELAVLTAFCDETDSGEFNSGMTFVRDDYFEQYAEQEAENLGMIPEGGGWPIDCIDWAKAASDLQTDYSSVSLDGTTYWYR